MDATFGPYRGLVRSWHDGDTCHVDLDLGFDEFLMSVDPFDGKQRIRCRIYGINAPELKKQEPQATEALNYAEQICPPGTFVTVTSHGWDRDGGRFDGSITLPDGSDFGQRMLAANQAIPDVVS